MNTVKVLIKGYSKVNSDGAWDATSTTTLIDTGQHKIIMDPGCHRQLLLKSLSRNSIQKEDIDIVFISHYHPDHCTLMGIFENATVYDSIQWQQGSIGGETGPKLPDTDIEIIKTPGHSPEHASLLVPTPKGKILVAADVFWWAEGEEQKIDISKHDDFASDQKTLQLSRSHTLQIADYIIPGHGKMFKVSNTT